MVEFDFIVWNVIVSLRCFSENVVRMEVDYLYFIGVCVFGDLLD